MLAINADLDLCIRFLFHLCSTFDMSFFSALSSAAIFVITPPTRLNSTVASRPRRRRRCVLGITVVFERLARVN